MARIEVEDVSLAYGGGGGVSEVSLDVQDGEFVALLGPSGSGKTTLLRLVGGFLKPDSGSIAIGGNVVAADKQWIPPEKRNLGMVFQQHAVWPHRSVFQNVEYPLKMSKIEKTERRERVLEGLELVGLEEFADRPPNSLSGGQQQRVALARALVARPAALLLDEPFASLDALLRERLRAELGNLAARTQTTVIHVTHDRTEAMALADRIAVIKDGAIEQVASPRELFLNPRTPFTASFVSDAALLPVEALNNKRFLLQGENVEDRVEFTVKDAEIEAGSSREGILAIRPHDLEVMPGKEATVHAAMFTGEALEVHLHWRGRYLRALISPEKTYKTGDLVDPQFASGRFFPDG